MTPPATHRMIDAPTEDVALTTMVGTTNIPEPFTSVSQSSSKNAQVTQMLTNGPIKYQKEDGPESQLVSFQGLGI